MSDWRPVVGYEGLYEVNAEAVVRSLDRRVACGFGATRVMRGKVLSPVTCDYYWKHLLYDENGVRRFRRLHLIVADAFLGPRPPGMGVLHRDDDKSRNMLSNLYHGTKKQNALDAVRNGKQRPGISLGEKHGHSKLRDDDIHEIMQLRSAGIPMLRIAKIFGVTDMTIHDVVKGKTWTHVSGLGAT